jgi:hypothetical protein
MDAFLPPTSNLKIETRGTAGMYLWQGNGILLLGYREDDRFVLARGWIEHDRLSHVRRWSFASPEQFSGQVRRLVMEASGDYNLAANERLASLTALASIKSI